MEEKYQSQLAKMISAYNETDGLFDGDLNLDQGFHQIEEFESNLKNKSSCKGVFKKAPKHEPIPVLQQEDSSSEEEFYIPELDLFSNEKCSPEVEKTLSTKE